MRPLELYMDGFKSYAEPVSFDFDGRGLFGIVGPTGSGKSTILEALIFALYGKTPRVQRESKKLINSQADEARVRLCFEADGVAWQADRVIRRKAASAVALKRLDGAGEPVGGERMVNERIVEILGLDFEAFCSSVSLPQGEFDRFLNATRAQRTEILKGLFRLERVDRLREAAKGRERFIEGQIQTLRRDVSAVPEDAADLLADARTHLEKGEARLGRIEAAIPAVLEAQKNLDLSRHELNSLEDARIRIEEALEQLPSGDHLSDLESRRDQMKRRAGDAEKAAKQAAKMLEEANLAMQRLQAAGRSEQWCADLDARIKERARLSAELQEAAGELEAAEKEFARLQPGRLGAESAVKDVEASLEAARRAVDDLRDLHAAHHLRSHLHAGESCPVCEQPVASVPAPEPLRALDEAAAAARKAERRLAEQRSEAGQIERAFAVAQDRKGGAQTRASSRKQALAGAEKTLTALVGKDADPAAELDSARKAITAARQQTALRMQEYQAASEAVNSARGELDAIAAARARANGALIHVAAVLAVDRALIETETLVSAAKMISEAGEMKLEALAQQHQALSAAAEASSEKIAAFAREFEALPQQSPADVLAACRSGVDELRRRVASLEEMLDRAAGARKQIATMAEEKALFERLIGDLTDSKFTAYLLDEQRRLLAAFASTKLFELTGRYVFDDEGEFNVIDQATGATRTPDTLSGGETFLASLSMALALAEAVALEGGRLGCFFLDEGFGSLDAESLDLALEGIEALAVPGRLIGLISHVGGIQARLDDLIVLEKKTDGSTSVCQDGGPISFSPAAI